MAKIKVKGIPEFVQVANEIAKHVDRIWKDDSVPRDFKVSVGNMSLTKGDIAIVITDKEDNISQNKEQVAYDRDRKEKVAWPIDKKLEFQRKYFELVKSLTGSTRDFESYMDETRKFLEEHPSRLWCDPRMWALEKDDRRQVGIYEAAALKVIFMVDANERAEERRVEEEKRTLAVFGR